jgi:hypothetical protein
MVTLQEITQVENRYCQNGAESLGEALGMLRERWNSGDRDRETTLRLMFLIWYSCAEPGFLTGLQHDDDFSGLFHEAFMSLGGRLSDDAEVCAVVGLMARMFPYCLCNPSAPNYREEEALCAKLGRHLTLRAAKLCPEGFKPEAFVGRGAYGQYMAHMAEHLGKLS